MRRTITASGIAMAIALFLCHSADAFPAAGSMTEAAAAAASTVQQVQYAERHGRHHVTKCYRELITGPYECHHYRYW